MNILDDGAIGGSKALIDLPAELAGQPSDLFDKVFEFTFDVLGIQIVELRAKDAGAPVHLADATHAPAGR